MTGTTFTSGHLCSKEDPDPTTGKTRTDKERLEEACWNGFLQMMLPEICSPAVTGCVMYLWQIREAGSFLELDLSEAPVPVNKQSSIDPYTFLPLQAYS